MLWSVLIRVKFAVSLTALEIFEILSLVKVQKAVQLFKVHFRSAHVVIFKFIKTVKFVAIFIDFISFQFKFNLFEFQKFVKFCRDINQKAIGQFHC